ncbi:MAG TPA: molybdate ABC transporter substrate-binding protein [Rhodanobacteraceae bacterium]|nr:molybdate ABC transporter substrate-binding protein [Rhodanobacteraceae bacterium]
MLRIIGCTDGRREYCRVLLLLLCTLLVAPSIFAAQTATLFAAASLKPALDDLAAHGALGTPAPRLVYAASSTLARQIEQGAPADVFISADEAWMDDVAAHDALAPGSRHDLLGNALVLVAPESSDVVVDLADPASIARALGNRDLAIALPKAVPAGRYASKSLRAVGLWNGLRSKLAMSRDVRAALELVAMGECPLGIVYRSDAVSEPRVRIVATFPPSSHTPIVYPAAIVRGHENAASRALLGALESSRARAVFQRYGFDLPER